MLWLKKVPYFVFCFWRLVLPLFLWQAPFWVTVGAVLLDIDWQLFVLGFTERNEDTYQKIDKALDFYWYTIALLFGLQTEFWQFFVVLFVIRLVGEILFYIKGDRKIFLYFPNIFENFFIIYIFAVRFPGLAPWLEGSFFWITFSVLVAFKLIQEYLVHVALFDLPTWIKEAGNSPKSGFKTDPKA